MTDLRGSSADRPVSSSKPTRPRRARPTLAPPPAPATETPASGTALRATIERGVAALRGVQEEDGCWKSVPDMGPLGLAITALAESWLGALTPADAKRYATSLKQAQRPDGGFVIRPFAKNTTLGATAVCRAALKACGVPDTAPAVKAAEQRLRELGGYARVRERLVSHGEPAALFCAMVGLVAPEALPPLSPDMAALPWSERMLDGRVHGGVPMVIYAVAAVRERFTKRKLLPGFLQGPTRALARARLAGYIGQFQNEDGSWNAALYCTVIALIALEGVGIDRHDPMVVRGLDFVERRKRRTKEGMQVILFEAENWETAFSILALDACGVPTTDPAIARAASYLRQAQCKGLQPRVNQPRAGAPRTGGWAFQRGNDTMPDCDDSAVVLAALGVVQRGRGPDPSVARGLAWLRGMQNPGGGFGSYVHGLPDKDPGVALYVGPKPRIDDLRQIVELLTKPPAEYGDPAIADLCGRVLWGLAECGCGADDPMVQRCIAFLERDACPDGSWWGIWNPAYVSGTAFVLLGLARAGADLRAPYVKKAVAWLIDAQNEDGGWGEDADSFEDPSLKAAAPSMPPLTGIALRALAEIAAAGVGGARLRKAGDAAARYLIATQEASGSWPNADYLFTIIPPTFYAWEHHRLYYVLFGLGRWEQVVSRAKPSRAKN